MRSWLIFLVAARQKLRDRLGLTLTLITAPLFVLLYWLFFRDAPANHNIVILDQDAPLGRSSTHGEGIQGALKAITDTNGARVFVITRAKDRGAMDRSLVRGQASLGLIVTRGFSRAVAAKGPPPVVEIAGDATSMRFRVSAALAEKAVTGYGAKLLARPPPILVRQRSVGLSGVRTPFEVYVPGLLVFAVIMLIFSSSMSVVRELEFGTLSRLRLTPVSSVELLLGLSAVQLVIGVMSVVATFAVAWLLGFRSEGSLVLAMAVASLASVASVGIGMFVASFARTQTRSFLISSVAMFLLVLFSGIIFPQPKVILMTLGGRAIDLFDLLPTTHMAGALSKILTLGAGPGEVVYELVFLTGVALSNYFLGALLLARTGRPSAQVWEGMV